MTSLGSWACLGVSVAVVLLLCHDPFLILWWPQKPVEGTRIDDLPLDMVADAIDDMFDGCRSESASVVDVLGWFERLVDGNVSSAWAAAERGAKTPAHRGLGEEHAVVMYMYTKGERFQQEFDKAVKTEKHKYSSAGFLYHYFYFYLTDAVQVLHRNQTPCRTTYHGTRKRFRRHVVNTNMRFGAFTLAATTRRSPHINAVVSCFEIYTCFGADVTYYSAVTQAGQVLIPPYEVFQITDVLTNASWCPVVYRLRSTRIPRRDLNCKLNQRQMETFVGAISAQWNENRGAIMLVCLTLLGLIYLSHLKPRQKHAAAAVLSALLVLMVITVYS